MPRCNSSTSVPLGRRDGDDGTQRGARAHRGEVRHRGGHRLEPEVLEWEVFRIEMDTEDGDVCADHGLSHEGRQHRRVVTDVAFARRDLALAHNLGDTLNDVIFTPGVNPVGDCWVSRCGA